MRCDVEIVVDERWLMVVRSLKLFQQVKRWSQRPRVMALFPTSMVSFAPSHVIVLSSSLCTQRLSVASLVSSKTAFTSLIPKTT